MILYGLNRSLDRAIGRSDADPPLHHQKGDLSKRKTPGVEIKLEHHLNSTLNLVACVTCAGQFISLVFIEPARETRVPACPRNLSLRPDYLEYLIPGHAMKLLTAITPTDTHSERSPLMASAQFPYFILQKVVCEGKRNLLSCWIAWLHEVVIKRDFIQVSYSERVINRRLFITYMMRSSILRKS